MDRIDDFQNICGSEADQTYDTKNVYQKWIGWMTLKKSVDEEWIGLMICKNFVDQKWIKLMIFQKFVDQKWIGSMTQKMWIRSGLAQ